VTLAPSIGNWNYACRSHYWIRKNQIQWAGSMSMTRIARIQEKDLEDTKQYARKLNQSKNKAAPLQTEAQSELSFHEPRPIDRIWKAIARWWSGN
jgi:hypothetical protein